MSIEKKKILLNFPLNNGGQEIGISEGGIEHFTGKLVESLCKEILQNSLDAGQGGVVKVKFELLMIPKEEIPEIKNLIKTLERCLEYWQNNSKAKKILTHSLESLKKDEVEVLRISDYGTSGLTGATETRDSNFYNLVKSSGASSKGGLSGGSFGIGKFAPFACSYPRTVFYSTLNNRGEYAFQGVARLVTHEIDGETTQGVGYIGNPKRNMPIINKEDIPQIFLREEIGTDINILGFNSQEDWKEAIIKSSLHSFFGSISEGKLELFVGEEEITKSTFREYSEKYLKKGKDYTADYIECLTTKEDQDSKKTYKEDFIYAGKNYGKIELHLQKSRGFQKKVAYLRSTGMKIIDKGNFRTAMRFTGVLKFIGEEINIFIRSLETPSHDKLEVERHDEPKLAKKILDELNKLVRGKVAELAKQNEGEELDIRGLNKFLPDNSKEEAILNFSLKKGKIKKITTEKYESQKKKLDIEKSSVEKENKDGYVEKEGDIGERSRHLGEGTKTSKGKGEKNKEKANKERKYSSGKIIKKKALINDKKGKKYKVIIESIEDKEVYFKLKAKYEGGGSETVKVQKIESLKKVAKQYEKSDTEISLSLKANQKEVLIVELQEEIYASMEVVVYEK